jgi:hypothetical protein
LQKEDQAAHLQTKKEALEQDVQGYARTVGVAKRRTLPAFALADVRWDAGKQT